MASMRDIKRRKSSVQSTPRQYPECRADHESDEAGIHCKAAEGKGACREV